MMRTNSTCLSVGVRVAKTTSSPLAWVIVRKIALRNPRAVHSTKGTTHPIIFQYKIWRKITSKYEGSKFNGCALVRWFP